MQNKSSTSESHKTAQRSSTSKYHRNKYCKACVHTLCLFLESISIRGFNRIVKARCFFIRALWICFLLSTTIFLIISIKRIVGEYLMYSINLETDEEMDAPTEFPSITFCNHQPFSLRAYQLWRSGHVMSPSQFNRLLRAKANQLVEAYKTTEQNESTWFPIDHVVHFSLLFDTVKMYYQNLIWPQHKLLGHERNETIYMCLIRLSGENLVLGGPGCHDPQFEIVEHSQPNYFNCFTLNINSSLSKSVQELKLILWLGPDETYDIKYREGFLHDLFEQAHGLRVAVHETKKLPNLDRQGFQIEPGRMNEINFEVIRKENTETPRKPCVRHPEQMYHDLEDTYSYEFEVCLQTHLQQVVVQKCSCLYAYLPRIQIPNDQLPYCGRFIENDTLHDKQLFRRLRCVQKIVGQFAFLRQTFEKEGKCQHRCTSIEYQSTISVTTWRVTQWQLYWNHELGNTIEQLAEEMPHPNVQVIDKLSNYLKSQNLTSAATHIDALFQTNKGSNAFSDRHTYLIVKRKRNDTLIRKETLVLTLDALVSRIGGLCSLYIGMTFAIFIEIIEFIYTMLTTLTRKSLFNSEEDEDAQAKRTCPAKVPPLQNESSEKQPLDRNHTTTEGNDTVSVIS